jgi:DNA-binding response OmpR family regulator
VPGDDLRQSHVRNPAEKPWTIAVISENVALARELVLKLDDADFRFACVRPQNIERFSSEWSTFDLLLLHLVGRSDCSIMRALLHKYRDCVVLLDRAATGRERAWWIENGADDCLSHPWDKEELLARLRASIRSRQARSRPSRILTVGSLSIALQERTASLDGRRLMLTSCEFALLVVLAERPGQVLSREELLDLAKGSAEQAFERAIDVQISRLRVKLRDDSREPRILKTVRGRGYVLVAAKSAAFRRRPSHLDCSRRNCARTK